MGTKMDNWKKIIEATEENIKPDWDRARHYDALMNKMFPHSRYRMLFMRSKVALLLLWLLTAALFYGLGRWSSQTKSSIKSAEEVHVLPDTFIVEKILYDTLFMTRTEFQPIYDTLYVFNTDTIWVYQNQDLAEKKEPENMASTLKKLATLEVADDGIIGKTKPESMFDERRKFRSSKKYTEDLNLSSERQKPAFEIRFISRFEIYPGEAKGITKNNKN